MYPDITKFGLCMNCLYRAANHLIDSGGGRGDGITLVRQLTKGIDQIRHLVGGGLDFFVNFVAIELQHIGFVQEFGVGNHGRKIMTEIMGNRAGGTGERGDPLGFDSLLLQSQQLATHLCKRGAEFNEFRASLGRDGVGKVAGGERFHTRDEIIERAGNRARHESDKQSAK